MKEKSVVFIDEKEFEYIDAIKYSFNGCEILSINEYITPPELEKLGKKINDNFEQVYFFDYCYCYYLLLPLISKNIKKKWIIKNSIPAFSNTYLYNSFHQILEYKERGLIDEIACLDYNMYMVFKDDYDFSYVKLDIEKKLDVKTDDSIGLLNYDYLESSSFFNQLSAITFTDISNVKSLNAMNVTKKMAQDFNLNIDVNTDLYEVISSNKINLYINFFDSNILNFIVSMDNDIICLLGNTSDLDNNKLLKENLVLESDDDINEIAEKIKLSLKHKRELLKEYSGWRKQYSKESKSLLKQFFEK